MKQLLSISILVVAMMLLNSCATTSEPAKATTAQASPTVQTAANAEPEVRQLMKEWEQAGIKNDKAWFERYYADSFVGTDPTGKVWDKKLMLAQWDTGSLETTESSTMDDLKIQMFGDVAIATYKVHEKGKNKTGNYDIVARATSAMVKKNGGWQVVAVQGTKIAPAK